MCENGDTMAIMSDHGPLFSQRLQWASAKAQPVGDLIESPLIV